MTGRPVEMQATKPLQRTPPSELSAGAFFGLERFAQLPAGSAKMQEEKGAWWGLPPAEAGPHIALPAFAGGTAGITVSHAPGTVYGNGNRKTSGAPPVAVQSPSPCRWPPLQEAAPGLPGATCGRSAPAERRADNH